MFSLTSFRKNKLIKKVIDEDIHIVMCCWKRTQHLEYQVKMLNNQSVAKKIHFHLVNNNQDNIELLDKKVLEFKKKYSNITLYLSHYDNKYYGFQRFFYIKDNILENTLINYVIIIDDDQYYDKYWVEKIYSIRQPKTYKGWHTRIFNNNIYLSNNDLNTKYVNYVGTGGCIIDSTIFDKTSKLWDIPNDLPDKVSVYNIEDLWLSFITNHYYNWSLEKSYLPELKTFNLPNSDSKQQQQCNGLYKYKQLLLTYLIEKGWNIKKKNNTNKIYKNNNIYNHNSILFKIKR